MNHETEAQLRNEATRGMQANDLLEHELLVEAFEVIQSRLTSEWADSPVRDTEGRERIWLMMKLLSNLKEHIRAVAETGKLASIQLERELSMVQKVKAQVSEWL